MYKVQEIALKDENKRILGIKRIFSEIIQYAIWVMHVN